jgi:putative ABC transport system ATP-binding protein
MAATLPASPIIRLTGVWKSYRSGESEAAVLQGLDLEVPAGQTIAIRGVSGSGKTSLLNLIGGIDSATRGQVAVCGLRLDELGTSELTVFRRERVGFVFQLFNLLPTLTALENVALALEAAGRPDRQILATCRRSLAEVGLAEKADKFPEQLSGGEQQRVAIARALAKEPPLLIADEPTGNLDEVSGKAVLSLLRELRERLGTTLVLATHDPVVAGLAHRVLTLQGGRLIEKGPPG